MKRMVSGIQPSNKITLGNYIGAIKNFVSLQDKYEMIIFVADLHAITIGNYNVEDLYNNKKEMVSIYLACGLDPKKTKIFYQSDVAAHTELEHVILCNTTIGELNRMTQYKDKSRKMANGTEKISTGLLIYPCLMAADILIYDADVVPVGADQKQHVELARNIAIRMNNKFGKIFKIPEPLIPKVGSRIMDLQDPTKKMSKSNKNDKGTIFLLDDIDASIKKIMNAKTDSLNKIKYDLINQPGISNLITIYSSLTDMKVDEIEKKFKNSNYGDFKREVSNELTKLLIDIQKKYKKNDSEGKITELLKNNAKYCNDLASKKMNFIYKKIGLKK